MERKTWRVNGEARMLTNGIEVCGPDAEYLAAYEDSGLTPKEVAKLVSPEMTKVARLLRDMLEGDTAQRMAELLRAAKEGWQPSCWIPVTERLPHFNQPYIVTALDEDASAEEGIWYSTVVVVAEYCNGYWTWDDHGTKYDLSGLVTHWMPLPEPPKEDER